ncbi:MAG: DUF4258 domain-containing protein [Candidatus Ozemobacteraceae bacterium]
MNVFLSEIRQHAKDGKILFLSHAIRQMSRPERMISPEEVFEVLRKGEIIEDYPEDIRGHCCLMLGGKKMLHPIHVICSPKEDYLAVITAYRPDPAQWTSDFRQRRKK